MEELETHREKWDFNKQAIFSDVLDQHFKALGW